MGIELRTSRQRPGVLWQALKRDTAFGRSWISDWDQNRFDDAFSMCLGITKFGGLTKVVSSKPSDSGFSATALRGAIVPSTFHV